MSHESDHHLKGSEVRLWNLIEERTAPGADVARIDQRIWDLFGEEWAVMFTDLSGFSRQVAAFGIIHFLQVIFEQKRLLLPIAAHNDGILVKVEADSFLIIFKRASSAVRCALEMQYACQEYNAARLPEEQVLLCVGIGFGRILRIGDSDVYGMEVNAASKLGEDTAKANEILVTTAVRDAAAEVPDVTFEDLGIPVPGSEQNYRLAYPPLAPRT
jgi:class 3 adenylate cyclase